jgi:hypothetical protein
MVRHPGSAGSRRLAASALAVAALATLPPCRLAAQAAPPPQPAFSADSVAVVSVVQTALEAMRTRDTLLLSRMLHPAMPTRIAAWRPVGGVAVPAIGVDSAAGWTHFVATAPAEMVLDERIGDPVVQVDGNLANVTAYYEFRRGEAFSHCGADEFVLGRTDAGWKIIALSYSVRTDGCRKDLAFTSRQLALRDMVQAEREFARYADSANTRDAFLWALRDDAITLDGEGVNPMRPIHQARQPNRNHLAWVPAWADMSADGTMGVTTGPWEWRATREAPVRARGQFLTIWLKETERWRVFLDLGVGGDSTLRLDVPVIQVTPGVTGRARLSDLTDLDRGRIRGDGWLDALRALAAPDVRVLREGAPLGIGPAALSGQRSVRFNSLGGRVAGSGDLAATWGTWKDGTLKGSYVRIWKRTREGWRVVVDRMGE